MAHRSDTSQYGVITYDNTMLRLSTSKPMSARSSRCCLPGFDAVNRVADVRRQQGKEEEYSTCHVPLQKLKQQCA
ncbi:jg21566 [Pararge aegeria aegeria]|uniref:Jg21566 protein n=1 Tax=Pararge aegeria aegeria TaxID=348720 RepID=A0A8S4RMI4_9NEOP|nr:jg21566 [Pararge aegeria aegeria]